MTHPYKCKNDHNALFDGLTFDHIMNNPHEHDMSIPMMHPTKLPSHKSHHEKGKNDHNTYFIMWINL